MLLLPRTYHPSTEVTDCGPEGGDLSGVVLSQNQGRTFDLVLSTADGDTNFAPDPNFERDRINAKPASWVFYTDANGGRADTFKVQVHAPLGTNRALRVEWRVSTSGINATKRVAARMVPDTARIACTPAEPYTVAARTDVTQSNGAGVRAAIEWYDENGEQISVSESAPLGSTGIKVPVLNATAPVDAVSMIPRVSMDSPSSGGGAIITGKFYIDSALVLKGTFATPFTTPAYFDGDTSVSYQWNGVPGNSSSSKLVTVSNTNTFNDFVAGDATVYWQTFQLPQNYIRGTGDTAKVPRLSGLQVFVGVDNTCKQAATVDWRIECYLDNAWTFVAKGTSIGTSLEGEEVWFNIYFDTPIDIEKEWVTNQNIFRFSVNGREAFDTTVNQEVEYDGAQVIIDNVAYTVVPDISPVPLQEGGLYPFMANGVPSLLFVEPGSERVLYSVQQGVNRFWYSTPNPLSDTTKLYTADGVTPIQNDGNDVSLLFRILAEVADEGTDFLGNLYRSSVTHNKVTFLDTFDPTAKNKFWLSKPNPSRYAVESLYFDLTTADDATARVVDHILLDPITPGVVFHVYFSNEETPGTDEESWENLLWSPVLKTFELNQRESFALPTPVTAKYIKLEFSHLQAQSYSPGNFQKPTIYKKHPKWVLDFFLMQQNMDLPTASRIEIVYDALDLAFSYYRDDITQEPDRATATILANPFTKQEVRKLVKRKKNRRQLKQSLGKADPITLEAILLSFQPWLTKPGGLRKKVNSALAEYIGRTDLFDGNYPSEEITRSLGDTGNVSSLDREGMILEKTFPEMFFYLTCRHGYREALATFAQDRAYFVGVRNVAFTREEYFTITDDSLYIEDGGDNVNVERNDFELDDLVWVTSKDA